MVYRLEILHSAQKQLEKPERGDRERVVAQIRALAAQSRPPGCATLSGRPAWRVRVGAYRVIYEIHDEMLLIWWSPLGADGACVHSGDVVTFPLKAH